MKRLFKYLLKRHARPSWISRRNFCPLIAFSENYSLALRERTAASLKAVSAGVTPVDAGDRINEINLEVL
jgi:hypothetical protein